MSRDAYYSQRMKIGVPYGAMPGDFLDPAPTIRASSLALLPSGFADASTAWQGSIRPTLLGDIDLVTGVPLDRYTDLELPFGGSVFRLTRTRSAVRPEYSAHMAAHVHRQDGLWDWSGSGWMASENPLLVINSTLPRVVGDGPPTCYLVHDAHRSIPFQLLEDQGVYEAPPRFRARMEHNGVWDTNLGGNGIAGWAQKPAWFKVYLYDDAVQYTFAPIWNTVPDNEYYRPGLAADGVVPQTTDQVEMGSHNRRPYTTDGILQDNPALTPADVRIPWDSADADHNPGLGLPHIGICTEIADRYGHRAKLYYKSVDGVALPPLNAGTGECQICYIDGQRLGQLSHIRLFRPDTYGEVNAWTLVYAHRRFARFDGWGPTIHAIGLNGIHSSDPSLGFPLGPSEAVTRFFDSMGESAVDRIYVFEDDGNMTDAELVAADLDTSVLADMLVFESTGLLPSRTDPLLDPIELFNARPAQLQNPLQQLPTNWMYRVVSQHYEHTEDELDLHDGPRSPASPPLLIRSSVEYADRSEPAPELALTNDHVFVYTEGYDTFERPGLPSTLNAAYSGNGTNSCDEPLPWLSLIYDAEALQDLRSAFPDVPGVESPSVDAQSLAKWPFGSADADYWTIVGFASTRHDGRLDGNTMSTNANGSAPTPATLSATHSGGTQYLKNEAAHLIHDGYSTGPYGSTVHTAVLTDEVGSKRYYRLHRFRRHPFALPGPQSISPTTDPLALYPSAFAHPYRVRSERDLWSPEWNSNNGMPAEELTHTPDLSKPRWIVVIDEFNSVEAMESFGGVGENDPAKYDGQKYDDQAYKLGMTNRRIVEMNATGYILRDRRWEYSGTGIVQSGSGLGEEFIYQKADDYFDAQVLPDPPADTNATDDWAHLREALLLVEHRSVGWSAADAENPSTGETNGLVMFYEYALAGPQVGTHVNPLNASIVTVAEGIQQGADTDPAQPLSGRIKQYKRQYFRDQASDPFTVTCTVDFTAPLTDKLPGAPATSGSPMPGVSAVHSITEYVSVMTAEDTDFKRLIDHRIMIGTPRQLYPNSDWYYPAEAEFYDDSGNPRWSANALAIDPTNPASGADEHTSVILTYFERDDRGRSIHTVMDAQPGSTPKSVNNVDVAIPQAPTGWGRLQPAGQSVDAINAITSFEYSIEYGLRDVFFPNGRRWSKRFVWYPMGHELNPRKGQSRTAREFIFNDLAVVGDVAISSSGPFNSESVGEVNDYTLSEGVNFPRGAPFSKSRVTFVNDTGVLESIDLGFWRDNAPKFQQEARVEIKPDGTGRLREASLLEPSVHGTMLAIGSKIINDLGEVYREAEIDGSISRTTKNQIGQALRTYAGTEDSDWTKPTLGNDPPNDNFNMYLTSRTEYGLSPNDAWLPVKVWEYRSNPGWYTDFYDEVASDTDGYATTTQYDWRMRPVLTSAYDLLTSAVLSTSVTYYDHADRPVLTATYGETPAPISFAAFDPTAFTVQSSNPSPADLFSVQAAPLSVTEHFYDPSGHTTETRSYDVSWDGTGGQPPYMATLSYRGRGDANVFSQSPGQPFTRSILDGLGRVAVEITAEPQLDDAPPYELTRTEHSYDGDGNVIETRRFVRVVYDPNNLLSAEPASGNAVRTTTVSWYNAKKQLLAQAELGTEQADGYVAGPQAFSRVDANGQPLNNDAPIYDTTSGTTNRQDLPNHARIWINQYDRASGRLVREIDPRGTVTEYQYSKPGRLARKIENAAADNARDRRYTEYAYRFGRLVEMVVPRFNATGTLNTGDPGVAGSDVHWADAEKSRIRYQADVLDEAYTPVSQNNQLVGQMWLRVDEADDRFDFTGPLELDAELGGTPDLELRYFFDGRVAERIDARGMTMRYAYDALGRLANIQIGYYDNEFWVDGYPASMNQPLAGLSDGSPSTLPVDDRVGFVEYKYDTRGQLQLVTAKQSQASTMALSQVQIEYDPHGRPTTEWQAIADAVDEHSTPAIAYSWTHVNTDLAMGEPGFARLSSMQYPMVEEDATNFQLPAGPAVEARRAVTFGYGTPGSIDHQLSRIVSLDSSVLLAEANGTQISPPAVPIDNSTAFTRTGDGRRVATTRAAGGIIQDYGDPSLLNTPPPPSSPIGLPGLDMFGSVKHVRYETDEASPTTLYAEITTRDATSNPTLRVVTQAEFSGQPRDNVRSHSAAYDHLGRLVANYIGEFDPTLPMYTPGGGGHYNQPQPRPLANVVRTDDWLLDAVGNWSGGQIGDFDGDHDIDNDDFQHLLQLIDTTEEEHACSGCPEDIADENGAPGPDGIVGFGDFLALMSLMGSAPAGRSTIGDLDGMALGGSGTAGAPDPANESLLLYHTADLRNRIAEQLHWDPTDSGVFNDPSQTVPLQRRTQTLYDEAGNLVFDGRYYFHFDAFNRLVQVNQASWHWDPSAAPPAWVLDYGDAVRRYRYDGFGRLIRTESPLRPGSAASGFFTEDFYYDGVRRIQERTTDPDAGTADQLRREYVWGGGDAGFDELLVQHDGDEWAERNAGWWSLFDTAGNMAALCDLDANGTARVAAQWSYEPYGDVIAAEHNIEAFPVQTLGHKGLFLDRLDNTTNGPVSLGGTEAHRLVPFAHSLYHNRNRAYAPSLGRFLQQDTNQTAMSLLEGSYHGSAMGAAALSYSLEELYGDGFSLYGYNGNNPIGNSDPTGLSWRESYEGVILPVVDAVTGMVAGDLLEILQGYVLMAEIHSFVQGAAYDREEQMDWALDWDSSDDDNPFFSRDGGFSDRLLNSTTDQSDPAVSAPAPFNFASSFAAKPRRPGQLNPIRQLGVPGEIASRKANNAIECKHYVMDPGAADVNRSTGRSGKNGLQTRRMYDSILDREQKLYMEVKSGYQSLSTRVKRQILFDVRAKRAGTVKDVLWEFRLNGKREPHPDLLHYLKLNGIKYTIIR